MVKRKRNDQSSDHKAKRPFYGFGVQRLEDGTYSVRRMINGKLKKGTQNYTSLSEAQEASDDICRRYKKYNAKFNELQKKDIEAINLIRQKDGKKTKLYTENVQEIKLPAGFALPDSYIRSFSLHAATQLLRRPRYFRGISCEKIFNRCGSFEIAKRNKKAYLTYLATSPAFDLPKMGDPRKIWNSLDSKSNKQTCDLMVNKKELLRLLQQWEKEDSDLSVVKRVFEAHTTKKLSEKEVRKQLNIAVDIIATLKAKHNREKAHISELTTLLQSWGLNEKKKAAVDMLLATWSDDN